MNITQNYGMTNNYQVGFKAVANKKLLTETIGLTEKEAETYLKRNEHGNSMLNAMSTLQFVHALKASQGVKEKLSSSIARLDSEIMKGNVNQFSEARKTIESLF